MALSESAGLDWAVAVGGFSTIYRRWPRHGVGDGTARAAVLCMGGDAGSILLFDELGVEGFQGSSRQSKREKNRRPAA